MAKSLTTEFRKKARSGYGEIVADLPYDNDLDEELHGFNGRKENTIHNLMTGDNPPASLILTNSAIATRQDRQSRKEKQDRLFTDFILQLAIQDNLRRIEEMLDTKRSERDQVIAGIHDNERVLDIYEAHRQGWQRADAYRIAHGHYDLNENGELADQDAEDMLQTWEQRTGQKINRTNTQETRAALLKQREYEERDTDRILRELKAHRALLERLDQDIHDLESAAQQAYDTLENGGNLEEANRNLQRELILKGNGTNEQKRELAKERGLNLPTVENVEQSVDDFDDISITPEFNQAVNARPDMEPEAAYESNKPTKTPVKRPSMNL